VTGRAYHLKLVGFHYRHLSALSIDPHIICPALLSVDHLTFLEMPTIPVVEVSHLPGAASFYAAVSQPLGIHFLPHHSGSSLNFGLPASPTLPCEVLFTLCESKTPQRSLLKFRASSQAAVNEFHWRALQANSHEVPSNYLLKHTAEDSVAQITDLDGNTLEARFNRRNSASLISNASTAKESRRVLDWQRDVARSLSDEASIASTSSHVRKASPQILSSSPRDKDRDLEPRLQRRETIATSHYEPRDQQSEAGNSLLGGISSQALIGTLLGAAAGAAVAYAMVKSEEPKPSEPVRPQLVSYHTSPSLVSPKVEEVERTIEALSSLSVSQAGSQAKKAEEPRHGIKYSILNGKSSSGDIKVEKSVSHRTRDPELSQARESEGDRDGTEISKGSRHTSKSSKHKEQRVETSSAAGGSGTGRSDKSYHEGHSKSNSKSEEKSEAKSHSSYATAQIEIKSHRSHRSHASPRSEASTVKPKEKARSKITTTLTVSNKEAVDKASQKVSQRDSAISARNIPLPESNYSVISARHYPLPESITAASVAPSDSISSIGMKRERGRRRM
jgi:hypothetical protein